MKTEEGKTQGKVGDDEHSGKERERSSRGVCKIGRKISDVPKLLGVRGRKELGLTGKRDGLEDREEVLR